ncbi:NAD+ synthase [Planctomicrobium sp. SH668]|uniref:NAD+ synthase n=1 Tax=Planctomicrobium sp. SH668 TaxID=3448126 RepID=UPI003F5C2D4C
MKIALAQLNPIVGNVQGNFQLIEQAALRAREFGAQLLITSELAISGYTPRDYLQRDGFVAACDAVVDQLAALTDDSFGILVGHPSQLQKRNALFSNSATLLHQGKVVATTQKSLLPNYDVFDEKRYFHPASSIRPIEFQGVKLGVHICEDAWWGEPETDRQLPNPIQTLVDQGAEILINLSASPFEAGKLERRHRLVRRHTQEHHKQFLFVNQVGANDDLVFDGNSFAMNSKGELIAVAKGFSEDLIVIDTESTAQPAIIPVYKRETDLLNALTLGLADYMRKSGFKECVLGLSGGIDSALAACIAARAIGAENVHGILMPSRYSSQHSIDDSISLAKQLGMNWSIVPIDTIHSAFEQLPDIREDLSSQPGGLAEQNLQARIRGGIVMTRSNRHNWIALATGNKSELAVGYCTLYGDMCGGFAVLSDLYKRDVYALSKLVNEQAGREIIPVSVIEKAPSAELAPNQFDQDTLPPYPVLDAILEALIDHERSPSDLVGEFPAETVKWVVVRLDRNEFKRRQAAPGVKLSPRAFGTGRRIPMAARGFIGFE